MSESIVVYFDLSSVDIFTNNNIILYIRVNFTKV